MTRWPVSFYPGDLPGLHQLLDGFLSGDVRHPGARPRGDDHAVPLHVGEHLRADLTPQADLDAPGTRGASPSRPPRSARGSFPSGREAARSCPPGPASARAPPPRHPLRPGSWPPASRRPRPHHQVAARTFHPAPTVLLFLPALGIDDAGDRAGPEKSGARCNPGCRRGRRVFLPGVPPPPCRGRAGRPGAAGRRPPGPSGPPRWLPPPGVGRAACRPR